MRCLLFSVIIRCLGHYPSFRSYPNETGVCIYQTLFENIGSFCSFLLTLVFSFFLYFIAINIDKLDYYFIQNRYKILGGIFTLALLFTLWIMLCTGFCSDMSHTTMHTKHTIFYTFICFVLLCIVCIYITIFNKMKNMDQSSSNSISNSGNSNSMRNNNINIGTSNNNNNINDSINNKIAGTATVNNRNLMNLAILKELRRGFILPLIMLVSFLPGTISRIYLLVIGNNDENAADADTLYTLTSLNVIFSSFYGGMIGLVFLKLYFEYRHKMKANDAKTKTKSKSKGQAHMETLPLKKDDDATTETYVIIGYANECDDFKSIKHEYMVVNNSNNHGVCM